ncbi:hypothetical protein L1987_49990 [Smallanthus sonchifolius]|uniref:Uncharacterized protein n=1 Tax=Smallanthus sonchifolius TaxID=185202 RepID=A0ACB9FW70_9ASTR|nr:hypothetical protein L1987_49990 [Smallanthus sonchifolius]
MVSRDGIFEERKGWNWAKAASSGEIEALFYPEAEAPSYPEAEAPSYPEAEASSQDTEEHSHEAETPLQEAETPSPNHNLFLPSSPAGSLIKTGPKWHCLFDDLYDRTESLEQ